MTITGHQNHYNVKYNSPPRREKLTLFGMTTLWQKVWFEGVLVETLEVFQLQSKHQITATIDIPTMAIVFTRIIGTSRNYEFSRRGVFFIIYCFRVLKPRLKLYWRIFSLSCFLFLQFVLNAGTTPYHYSKVSTCCNILMR